MNESFRRLFYPRSVAVVGASGNPLKMGHQCMLSLRESDFPGPVYPIHPQEREILGIRAYPNLDQVPGRGGLGDPGGAGLRSDSCFASLFEERRAGGSGHHRRIPRD